MFPFLRGEKRNDDVVLSSVADALRQLLVCSSSSILVSNGNFNSIRNSFTFRISFRVYRASENKYVRYLRGQKLTWYVSSFFKDGHILVKLYRASLPTTDTTAEISLAILTIDPLSSKLIELLQPSFLRNAFLRFPLNCSSEYSTAVVFFEIITDRSRFRRRDNFNEISWYCLLWKHTKTNEAENFVKALEEIFSWKRNTRIKIIRKTRSDRWENFSRARTMFGEESAIRRVAPSVPVVGKPVLKITP